MDNPKLAEAYAARQGGQPQRTVDICRAVLADEPDNREARSLLAVCFVEAGHIDRAGPLIEETVRAEPGNWRLQLNLSVLREAQGRMDDAMEAARSATERGSDRFESWGRLGDLAGRAGDFETAAEALSRALALKPDHVGVARLLAAAAYEAGKYDTASTALDMLEGTAPETTETLRLRMHVARRLGDNAAFIERAKVWLAAEPQSEEARASLAHGLAQQDDFHTAVEVYRPLVEGNSDNADHAATLAQYLLWSRDFDAAGALYERALSIDPRHSTAASGLARLNVYRGNLAEAASFARKAIEANPANVDGYSQLALATDMQLTDSELAGLRSLEGEASADSSHRAIALFTLGDVLHKRREHDSAFAAWENANALKHAEAGKSDSWRYDAADSEARFQRIAALDASMDAPAASAGHENPTPLFIVGMPRSGTTLLETALAAHSQVASGGELPVMPILLDRFMAWADASNWQGGPIPSPMLEEMRHAYLQQYTRYGIPAARYVTDKQPANVLGVGLIRRLFPDSPIIHIARDPVENGLSIFRNNFTKSWRYSTAMEDIGHYYGQYVRLMEHWRSAFGASMAEVRLEALAEDFENELRHLLEFAGLPWEEAVLRYFERDSTVTTLSSAQVRKAPSTSMVSSSAPYQNQLQPLRDALTKAGVPT
ncbi:tetratricopeptide repeat-containing sulfotransferase family protein [Parerythrobacter aestuarii]|uniref:tetratricopeptide repeat-containing sulfotransferase family protein n=1 Tax=Parerythrobacter aestuarii TaxID=3020909 RepID=UPI0024DE13C4|nr:tetratricopeptide repeat-containing sulfotransferase family protein [Parerythrobacter aestuarii]